MHGKKVSRSTGLQIAFTVLSCTVKHNRRTVVNADFDDSRKVCEDYKDTEVCASQYKSEDDGIFACLITIEEVNDDLEGDWKATVKRDGDESDEAEFELKLEGRKGSSSKNKGLRLVNRKGKKDLKICVDRDDVGDDVTIKVEFETNGDIDKVRRLGKSPAAISFPICPFFQLRWTLRKGSDDETRLREGETRNGHRSYDVEEDVSSFMNTSFSNFNTNNNFFTFNELQSNPYKMFSADFQPSWPSRPNTKGPLLFYFLKLYNFGF